jgi:signal transduction histidine kinase/DNA-binding response OmpR family regulator/HPt (histidine-containing phosphotransfer) domain-containing protein/HAMP domain-containing protein
MNTELKNQGLGITLRTALLSWLVTISTLLLFVGVIIPQQKRIFLENLESKASGVAVSLHEVAAGAAVNEDFSSVVDHCTDMLNGDPTLDYIVITKNDGFSLICDRTGWHSESNAEESWRPQKRQVVSGIGTVPVFNRRVFHYSQPFDYSGIQWGWINVGLSLQSYDRNVALVYQRTGLLAIFCIMLSLAASGLYAKRLVKPILSLEKVVQKVAGGDLSARASVASRDELGSLANSVNSMTEALLRRDKILQSVRFAAQEFLSTSKWEEVIEDVLAKIGEAAAVSRIRVLEFHSDGKDGPSALSRFHWYAPDQPVADDTPPNSAMTMQAADFYPWRDSLNIGESIAVSDGDVEGIPRQLIGGEDSKSALVIPILVEGAWWGSLTLVAHDSGHEWTPAEQDSLRAAADMLGAAITRQRTQDDLLRAKEAAEAASVAKSQFLANMSHEIRTPITGVLGMLELLRCTNLDDKQRRYVSNTMASAETLLTVIGDVLDFSKIEAGKLDLEETTFTLPDVLEASVRLLAEKAEAKGVELACRVADDVTRQVVGDPDRLRQVLINLLSNAVKFTESGSVVLSCSLVAGNQAKTLLRFEVKDTGCGIAPQHQALIFDAFCQADNSMSRIHGGTGLGLTICRQIVRLLGGEIGVQSTLGQGSLFWFTAQFKCVDGSDDCTAHSSGVDMRGKRVLVVDDCAVAREIVCDYVRAWKGLPEEAPEASTGLEKLRSAALQGEPFSVALLDWRMPGLDGFALARLIKQEPSLSSTGLVLLSGFAKGSVEMEFESAGFAAALAKPVRKSELYDAIVTTTNGRLHQNPKSQITKPLDVTRLKSNRASLTVLLAEDNDINQEVASEILAALGYDCKRVRNGREALATVKNGLGDLVLMDCQMPEMDGYEATRLIRQWEQQEAPNGRRGRRLPVVALTAHAMKGDRARCLEAGMDDYLTKPLEIEELAKTLTRWLPRPEALASPGNGTPVQTFGTIAWKEGIDYQGLLRRCMGNPDLAGRLIQKFLSQATADIVEIDAAVSEQDAKRLRQVAHRLKGTAANLSAEAVRECAARLELLAHDGNLGQAAELVALLRASMETIEASAAELTA